MVDRDRLFRDLLKNFFLEFVDLFFPKIAVAIDPKSIRFLEDEESLKPQEQGEHSPASTKQEASSNVLVQVRLRGQESCFWVHLENSSETNIKLERRIFHTFARLDEKYNLPIYPIILQSSDKSQRLETNGYRVEFVDRRVLDFSFVAIQLHRLNWRDFLQRRNPVAAALMPTMNVQTFDRPVVKAECLRLLTNLRLDAKKVKVISQFIEAFLHLNAAEEQVLQTEMERMGLLERERITNLLTSTTQANQQQGAEREALSLVFRLLKRRIGDLNPDLEAQVRSLPVNQVEDLGEALLDFNNEEDLKNWLRGKTA
ncbi:DUF4351 domain-containing protein [Acaryochloris marina]|uniref:DUF4351 domain-containing protein n=1 Tax=Acaryochloris marina (strain MBIC 11017) TaxID=329726 RepID=B0C251_ACAM1|nr:DUF4351 domain-containing protein [Acaryochloris marina]ABW27352.1 conserved hypothetical protein [Acaryochloris marina MBIC11017]BDM82093.1 hypothetical protein AM10699_49570 [Acaryochloris marina MBIC10699]